METSPCIKVEENGDGLEMGTIIELWEGDVIPKGFIRLEDAKFDAVEDDGVISLYGL